MKVAMDHPSQTATSPGNQINDQNDQRDDQQKMNQAASDMEAEAQ
jgi:hypothetical protein